MRGRAGAGGRPGLKSDPLVPVPRRRVLGVVALVLAGLMAVAAALVLPGALADARERRVLAAHADLAETLRLPDLVPASCSTPATRCWTSDADPQEALVGADRVLEDAGVQDVRTVCGPKPRQTPAPCQVTGLLAGEPVLLAATGVLAPEPPLEVVGTEVVLHTAVDGA